MGVTPNLESDTPSFVDAGCFGVHSVSGRKDDGAAILVDEAPFTSTSRMISSSALCRPTLSRVAPVCHGYELRQQAGLWRRETR